MPIQALKDFTDLPKPFDLTPVVHLDDGTNEGKRTLADLPFISVINVITYGATGDGTTDDTTAINDAKDATGASHLYFPKGTYSVGVLEANVANQIWEFAPGAKLVLRNSINTTLIKITADGVKIIKAVIDGNKANQSGGSGIMLNRANNVTIDGCDIRDTWQYGIYILNCDEPTIINNKVVDSDGIGIFQETTFNKSSDNLLNETFPTDGPSASGWTEFGSGTHDVFGGEWRTQTSGGADGANKTFGTQTEGWCSFDYRIEDLSGLDPTETMTGCGFSKNGQPGNRLLFGVTNQSGTLKYAMHPQENPTGRDITIDPGVFTFVEDVTVNVVMHWKVASGPGANDGIAQAWINDVQILDLTTEDSDELDFNGFTVGNNNGSSPVSATIFMDNIRVGNFGGTLTNGVYDNNIIDRSSLDPTTISEGGLKVRAHNDHTQFITKYRVTNNKVFMPVNPSDSSAICIEHWDSRHCVVSGNQTEGGVMGISLDLTDMITCTGNTIFNHDFLGIELTGFSDNCTITGNTVDGNNNGQVGIVSTSTMRPSNFIIITGNTISNLKTGSGVRGIQCLGGDGLIVSSNTIDQLDGTAIEIGVYSNFVVSSNYCHGNDVADSAITLDESTHGTITGNLFRDFINQGINLFQTSAGTIDNIAITGNSFENVNVPLAVSLSGGAVLGDNIRIIGNPGFTRSGITADVHNLLEAVYELWGSGSPEGVVTAGVGSIFHSDDGGFGDVTYIKASGTGNTGWSPVQSTSLSADKGNASDTLSVGTDETTALWNTPLTATRTVTLSTTGAVNGHKFRIVRGSGASGGFSLEVGSGPLKTLTSSSSWCDVEYNGSAWVLTGSGTL